MSDLARTDTPILTSRQNVPRYAREDRPYEGDPWSRQSTETSKAYECFTIYLQMEGDRSATRAGEVYCERHGLKYANIAKKWSAWHRWVERAEAFDSFMTAKEIRQLQRQRVKAARRHMEQSQAAQEVHMLPLLELRKRIAEQGGELAVIAEMDEANLIRLWKAMGGGAELTTLQKAERDAITAGTESGPATDTKVIAERGAVLRKVLGNPELVAMFERVTIEGSAETVEAEPAED